MTARDQMPDRRVSRRHRWAPPGDHFFPGPKYWRSLKCGLQKMTEFECKPSYRWTDGRTWKRFAPPCPPDAPPIEGGGAHGP